MRQRDIQAVLFDVFGTLVDWRSGVARALRSFADRRGITLDADSFATQWRAKYRPSIDVVNSGQREYTPLDQLHLENLVELLDENAIDTRRIPPAELTWLNQSWQRLDPWADCVAGLHLLKRQFMVGTLSNGTVSLLTHLSRHAGLPWDAVIGSDVLRVYKPNPTAYLRAAQLLDIAPESIMLCAAHNDDLHAAQALGFRTAFVRRPIEYGPGQRSDLEPTGDYDVVASSLTDAARALCSESDGAVLSGVS
ncbi:MAG TPA: haloacid dehalogenase type II [Jatrophihabitans sp.]|nr:haloacid dehalogenase type II [Jatrophihabitans sp.]